MDGTEPVPPKMQVSRNICAVMGGTRSRASAWRAAVPAAMVRTVLPPERRLSIRQLEQQRKTKITHGFAHAYGVCGK